VLGRVNDSLSIDSILFAFFAGEREDLRADTRRESNPEKGQTAPKVLKVLKTAFFLPFSVS
jgi:hypothetical protein